MQFGSDKLHMSRLSAAMSMGLASMPAVSSLWAWTGWQRCTCMHFTAHNCTCSVTIYTSCVLLCRLLQSQLSLVTWVKYHVLQVLYAAALIPIGLLADRVNRPRLLAGGLVMWSLLTMTGSKVTRLAMLCYK